MPSFSFATFLIVCPTSFFLGIIFSLFPYDYPVLWSTTPTPTSHYDLLEAHLRLLHAAPNLITGMLHFMIFLGLAGLVIKLYKPSESNMLFDGGSLFLYMCGVVLYIANIVKGLRIVTAGDYGMGLDRSAKEGIEVDSGGFTPEGETVLGREDNLKVLSASNTILALVLVGVLVLQAGQWYAERAEARERKKMEQEEKAAAAKGDGGRVDRRVSGRESKKAR